MANEIIYCKSLKSNYFVLGYFGRNVMKVHTKAQEIAKKLKCDISTMEYDEIQTSRRHKHKNVMYSTVVQEPIEGAFIVENAWQLLSD